LKNTENNRDTLAYYLADNPADYPGVFESFGISMRAKAACRARRAQQDALRAKVDLDLYRLQARQQILEAAQSAEEADRDRRFRNIVHEAPSDLAKLLLAKEAERQQGLLQVEQLRAKRRVIERSVPSSGGQALPPPEALRLSSPLIPETSPPAVQPEVSAKQIEQTALHLMMQIGGLPYQEAEAALSTHIADLGRYLPKNAVGEIARRIGEMRTLLT
jgi:hypothetical protein